jgi:hypothetical protein
VPSSAKTGNSIQPKSVRKPVHHTTFCTSASMERHMEIAAPIFRKFAGLLDLTRVDFYGQPSETLLERMRQKAELLGRERPSS